MKQRKSTNKIIVKFVVLLILSLILVWYFGDEIRVLHTAPTVSSHQWRTHSSRSDLKIRKVKNDESALLIKPEVRRGTSSLDSTDGAVQYDPPTKTFKLVSQQNWEAAQGEIKTCDETQQNEMPARYDTYGLYALVALKDSKAARVAVLSAAGPKILPFFSLLPGQATGRILGTRYIEIFYPNDSTKKSRPIRVIADSHDNHSLCWSPFDDFVVVYDSYFNEIWVINADEI